MHHLHAATASALISLSAPTHLTDAALVLQSWHRSEQRPPMRLPTTSGL